MLPPVTAHDAVSPPDRLPTSSATSNAPLHQGWAASSPSFEKLDRALCFSAAARRRNRTRGFERRPVRGSNLREFTTDSRHSSAPKSSAPPALQMQQSVRPGDAAIRQLGRQARQKIASPPDLPRHIDAIDDAFHAVGFSSDLQRLIFLHPKMKLTVNVTTRRACRRRSSTRWFRVGNELALDGCGDAASEKAARSASGGGGVDAVAPLTVTRSTTSTTPSVARASSTARLCRRRVDRSRQADDFVVRIHVNLVSLDVVISRELAFDSGRDPRLVLPHAAERKATRTAAIDTIRPGFM